MRLLSIVLLIVVFILCFAFIHQNMRLKGGADDKILYYDLESGKWDEGNTEEEYDISIKYNDNTEDIAIEVGRRINKLFQDGVMDEGKIERINIDVTTKNGEYKIGRNFKIYWSENNNMITVGCEYNSNCLVHRINKEFREINQMYEQAYDDIEDKFKKATEEMNKNTEQAIKEIDAIFEAARKELDDDTKEEDNNVFYLRPVQNPNTNINTNEVGLEEFNKQINQSTNQAYTDIAADNEEFNKQINQSTNQAYTDIAADNEALRMNSMKNDKTNNPNNTNLETNNLIENINTLLENYYNYCKEHYKNINDYCSLEEYLKINEINVTDNDVVHYIKENLEAINETFKEKHKDDNHPLELIREPDLGDEIYIEEYLTESFYE